VRNADADTVFAATHSTKTAQSTLYTHTTQQLLQLAAQACQTHLTAELPVAAVAAQLPVELQVVELAAVELPVVEL
jgi:hypothetical protein